MEKRTRKGGLVLCMRLRSNIIGMTRASAVEKRESDVTICYPGHVSTGVRKQRGAKSVDEG